jgi:glycosyltransferase involved in cell wall biosynthesis
MNVLYVYDGHWPFQATRPIKQSDVLLSAGHHVTMLSRGSPAAPRSERHGNLSVERLPSVRSRLLDRLVNYPVFLNPYWLRHILKHARRSQADCIIVGDLPLAPAAVLAGRREGVPVHYDMAEVYPVAMHSVLPHESSAALKVARASRAADAVERWVLFRVATTFVVSDESRDRCLRLGVPPERVVLVGNTPANAEALRAEWPVPADIADLVSASGRMVIFIGNVYADRGLAYAIEAMAHVVREIPNAVLVIVGEGRERPNLEAQVARAGLGAHVRFLGWKHHSEHPAYLRHAHIGLLPFMDTQHIRITLANKLFDYMGAGVPIVASDVPSMRRVIEETGTGVLAPAGDGATLAKALIQLFQRDDLRAAMGAKGLAAIAGPYDWGKDADRFLEAIERDRGTLVES